MRALLENPLWHKALAERKWQRFFGAVSGIFLAVALLSLLDGIIAQMREGQNLIQLLPGQEITLSGPCALKQPLERDLIVRFTPADAPLTFTFDGFFSGYWFGNGMWRARISAAENANPGKFSLQVSFRGASATTAQGYQLEIFANASVLQAASLSQLQRHLGINPFVLAGWTGLIGVICGSVTYIFGRLYHGRLRELGLSEICAADPRNSLIWCLVPPDMSPHSGFDRMVLDASGHVIAEARTLEWKRGRLQLALLDRCSTPPGALVCLRHPSERLMAKADSI